MLNIETEMLKNLSTVEVLYLVKENNNIKLLLVVKKCQSMIKKTIIQLSVDASLCEPLTELIKQP